MAVISGKKRPPPGNLLNLLKKDYLISRRFLIPLLLFYMLYAAQFYAAKGLYLSGNLLFTIFLGLGLPLLEERSPAGALIASLPLKRATLVRARYASVLILTLAGAALCFGYGTLLKTIFPAFGAHLIPALSLNGLILFLLITIAVQLLFLPCFFRWGIRKALIFLISLLPATAALGSLISRPLGSLLGTGDPAAVLGREIILVIATGRSPGLEALLSRNSFMIQLLLVAVIPGLLTAASLRAAQECYKKREL